MDRDKSRWVQGAIQQFEGRLLRYTGRFVPIHTAQEIVQETFLRLWEQDMAKVKDHLAQWLFTVCRNQAVDRCRAEGRNLDGPVDGHSTESNNPETLTTLNRDLSRLVSRLPPAQREVLRLKFEEDLSYKEISAITGHSVSYVGVLIHEAIAKLRIDYE
ncbi:MAG: RNA polymerase sigma factor [Bdellovibrionales bacterium]